MTAVKGPSREGQSPPEHGLHVLGSDCFCHGYSQQAGPARHPAPSLSWSGGKSLVVAPLLIHPVQFHPRQPRGQPRRRPRQITLHTTALHNCCYQISTLSSGVLVKITTSAEHGALFITVVPSLLFSIKTCNSPVMAGHDIGRSARILTRVSVK